MDIFVHYHKAQIKVTGKQQVHVQTDGHTGNVNRQIYMIETCVVFHSAQCSVKETCDG